MKNFVIVVSLYCAIASCAFAQNVVIPDIGLERAVRSALVLPPHQPITRIELQHIKRIKAEGQGIISLVGLEHATGLESLELSKNQISDLTPLANLVRLNNLALGKNVISNIAPLANLVSLRELHLTYNMVRDVSPLANLSELRKLKLRFNLIEDFTPLANITGMIDLDIRNNPALDYSALEVLRIPYFEYDQHCDISPLPVHDRIANRQYPSIGMPWGSDQGWQRVLDRPDLTRIEQIALHDFWIGAGNFDLHEKQTPAGIKLVGNIAEAQYLREQYLSFNSNLIIVKTVPMREADLHSMPPDSPFWIRDANGNIVLRYKEDGNHEGLVDFTNPVILARVMDEVRATAECGLYDGVFFDYWNDDDTALAGYVPLEAEQRARMALMNFIRSELRPNFLVFVNGGSKLVGPMTGPLVNGTFMETVRPATAPQEDMPANLLKYENTLKWSETTLRQPHVNFLEGWANPNEPLDSPTNLRWMRVFTTLSLTHSDGYVLFTNGLNHRHLWYDFWDADLGRPVGEKGQLYQDIEGLYIREFTHGWAVYNHSGEARAITLPEEAQGVASDLVGTKHTLPNLDGEIYLRVKPKNPADVNEDGVVNILDLILVAQAIGAEKSEPDVNGDGVINVFDLVMVAGAIGGGGAAPPAYSPELSIINAADVERWLAGAQGLGAGDANFQRGIRFLEGLLVALTPKETTLLPNYPNPFNPETWIPYRLSREAEVAITIYDTKGTLVRRLTLGNQAAGYYAVRGRAAYWDGRNESGEAVASGIYIYQFRAGDYAASRRMVIVK